MKVNLIWEQTSLTCQIPLLSQARSENGEAERGHRAMGCAMGKPSKPAHQAAPPQQPSTPPEAQMQPSAQMMALSEIKLTRGGAEMIFVRLDPLLCACAVPLLLLGTHPPTQR